MPIDVEYGPGTLSIDPDWDVQANRTIRVTDHPDLDIDVEIVCFYDRNTLSIEVERVTATRRPHGPEVNSVALRTIRVSEFIATRQAQVIWRRHPTYRPGLRHESPEESTAINWFDPMPIEEAVADARALGLLEQDRLLWTNRVFTWAMICNLNPVQELSRLLGVSTRTATRRIAELRASSEGEVDDTDG